MDASDPVASEVGAGTFWQGIVDDVNGPPLPTVLEEIQDGWPTRTPTRFTRLGVTANLGLLLLPQTWRAPWRWSEPALPASLLAVSRGGGGDEQQP